MEEVVFETGTEKIDRDSPGKNVIRGPGGTLDATQATKYSPVGPKWICL